MPVVVDILASEFEDSPIISKDFLEFMNDIKWESYIDDIVQFVAVGAGSVVETAVNLLSSVISGVATVFVSIIFAIYLLFARSIFWA